MTPAPAAPAPATPGAPPVTPSIGPRAAAPRPEPPRVAAPPVPPPAAPPTAPPVPPGQRGRFIVLNFDNADIETVIHAASEILGFNYVLGPGVSGKKVTVQTSGRIPQEDVFGVLLAILEVHGVTAVRSGNLYKIVPIEGARERAVPTIVGTAPDPARATDEVITQIVPVRFAPVNDLGTLLRPLISSRGTLIANRETGVLIITDSASNIARLLDIIRLVDVEVALDELQIIPLQYADAADTANILNQLFQSGRLRTSAAAGAAPAPVPPGVPAAPAVPGAAQPGGTDRPPLIVAERRSNSLIVNARKGEMETIRRVIEKLDVNITGGRRVFIYYAENAKAKDLAATLNAIYGGRETVQTTPVPTTSPGTQAGRTPGQPPPPPPPPPSVAPGAPLAPGTADAPLTEGQVRFIADETTNAIIASTTPRQWADIEATIKQLDRMPRQVLIEVLVAEITLTDNTRLGIDWAIKQGNFRLAQQSNVTQATGFTAFDALIGRVSTVAGLPFGGLNAFAIAGDEMFALLNALAADNKVNVISNPHVMTSENKKAVINVSVSIPIITSQQAPVGGVSTTTPVPGQVNQATATNVVVNQTVEYRDAGVVLTVTPRIGERGTVALDVKQEVNDIGDPEPPTGSRRINKREAETSVVLLNNQTLVLAGLITERRGITERGIPFLKDIPILGYLFGTKENTLDKRELVLLITPRVVGTAIDAARITEEMRRAAPEVDKAIRNAPRPPTSAPPAGAPPTAPEPAAPAPPPPAGVPVIPPVPPPPSTSVDPPATGAVAPEPQPPADPARPTSQISPTGLPVRLQKIPAQPESQPATVESPPAPPAAPPRTN
ncbi:MAG TPA: type II secretion system secretin GspD [Methylomirabilota bacterium]|nr:type II secretion system secretin GspD [Methylomirabilota bacterium]